ncbi:MAG: 3-dehydroquinate synthase [Bacteroidales bacterium]|jgi:3-dehydroquinate synthase|nr:3-dehydroquinate synthase [Bacteroidales bacterium]
MDNNSISILDNFLSDNNFSSLFILADETVLHRYPDFWKQIHSKIPQIIYPFTAKETNKSIEKATEIWNFMIDRQLDRNTLMLNWGGGITSDLGGFVAANYKRGIRFINVPTTLLSLIDASIGGKNGVNISNLKNGIGTFYFPDLVLKSRYFLRTLPQEEWMSGFGELLKYALIANKKIWNEMQTLEEVTYYTIKQEWLQPAIDFKDNIVSEDPYETGLRKILNAGHSIGHVIEAVSSRHHRKITHGHAVALGLVVESNIAMNHELLSIDSFYNIKNYIKKIYKITRFSEQEISEMSIFIQNDKKKSHNYISIPLITKIGSAKIENEIKIEELIAALVNLQSSFLN